jgi:hypothetical protein
LILAFYLRTLRDDNAITINAYFPERIIEHKADRRADNRYVYDRPHTVSLRPITAIKVWERRGWGGRDLFNKPHNIVYYPFMQNPRIPHLKPSAFIGKRCGLSLAFDHTQRCSIPQLPQVDPNNVFHASTSRCSLP